jgi:hypothetical protein
VAVVPDLVVVLHVVLELDEAAGATHRILRVERILLGYYRSLRVVLLILVFLRISGFVVRAPVHRMRELAGHVGPEGVVDSQRVDLEIGRLNTVELHLAAELAEHGHRQVGDVGDQRQEQEFVRAATSQKHVPSERHDRSKMLNKFVSNVLHGISTNKNKKKNNTHSHTHTKKRNKININKY